MPEITVHAASKTYPVYISANALEETFPKLVKELGKYSKVFVLTDENVANYQLDKLQTAFSQLADVVYYVTPSGETAKTFSVYEAVMTKAIEEGLDRKSALVAFGGGVIGDLGGFVAATYMRGIAFYQLPTTVLAHDSAVGGKVAINHPLGKNMIGNFYQPEAVIYDTSLLQTLSEREMRSGFAELIKHALIQDHTLLTALMATFELPSDLYTKDLSSFLARGIEIKAQIVAEDETEQGVRAFLNFGHTFGHALEAYGGFGKWLHGEAVIYGMLYAIEMSQQVYQLDFDVATWKKWLAKLGYEVHLPAALDWTALFENMKHDKKTTYGQVNMVLLKKIGEPVIYPAMEQELKHIFDELNA